MKQSCALHFLLAVFVCFSVVDTKLQIEGDYQIGDPLISALNYNVTCTAIPRRDSVNIIRLGACQDEDEELRDGTAPSVDLPILSRTHSSVTAQLSSAALKDWPYIFISCCSLSGSGEKSIVEEAFFEICRTLQPPDVTVVLVYNKNRSAIRLQALSRRDQHETLECNASTEVDRVARLRLQTLDNVTISVFCKFLDYSSDYCEHEIDVQKLTQIEFQVNDSHVLKREGSTVVMQSASSSNVVQVSQLNNQEVPAEFSCRSSNTSLELSASQLRSNKTSFRCKSDDLQPGIFKCDLWLLTGTYVSRICESFQPPTGELQGKPEARNSAFPVVAIAISLLANILTWSSLLVFLKYHCR